MASKVGFTNFDKFLAKFQALPDQVNAGVVVTGPAAAYAETWELGATHLSQPGPKTMWSTNALGETVILTTQAPNGYVRINRQQYVSFIQDELKNADFSEGDFTETLKEVMSNAAERSADLIAETAPVDTGQLRDSILVVEDIDDVAPGDDEAV